MSTARRPRVSIKITAVAAALAAPFWEDRILGISEMPRERSSELWRDGSAREDWVGTRVSRSGALTGKTARILPFGKRQLWVMAERKDLGSNRLCFFSALISERCLPDECIPDIQGRPRLSGFATRDSITRIRGVSLPLTERGSFPQA